MRKRLYEIIEVSQNNDRLSSAYDIIVMITIVVSIIPLAFKSTYAVFGYVDLVTTSIFIVDYLARLITADYKLNLRST